jgi:hypothetical protein
MSLVKPEFPPLLPPGFHLMTLAGVRQLCVVAFPLSTTRAAIMDGLESVIAKLAAERIEGEVWIDGSFLTRKIDPSDSDIVVAVKGDFVSAATPDQKAVMNWIESNLKGSHRCDSYLHVAYPAGHDLAGYSEWMRAYWIRQTISKAWRS